jgi:filamentous hemagglutinin
MGIAKPGWGPAVNAERGKLARLRQNGIPTVETFPSRPGTIVYQKYAAGSKDPDFGQYLNQRSLGDLNRIENQFRRNGVAVRDLQFLVGPNGRLVVNDPGRVHVGGEMSWANQRKFDNLRQQIWNNQ